MTTGRSFHIEACLGRGGFGEVYRARMRRPGGFETEVALKVLRADVDPRGQGAERLRDEARLLGLVRHRAIPRVFDLVELDGRLVLVTEYVDGEDLSRCLKADPPMPPRAAVEVAAALADALHAAWHTPVGPGRTTRIVHRDLKPANVRIGRDGSVRLLDFGIAWTDEVTRVAHTHAATLLGSPAYMAPERFDGQPPDPANDVYGVGAVLFEALAGRRLFDEMCFRTVAALVLVQPRFERTVEERFAQLPPHLPPELVALVRRLLAWSPDDRPTALEAAEALEALAPSCPGDGLVAWCRARRWPERSQADGPWVGRTLTESQEPPPTLTTHLHTLSGDALEEIAPEPLPTAAPVRLPAWLALAVVLLAGVALLFGALGDPTGAPAPTPAPPVGAVAVAAVPVSPTADGAAEGTVEGEAPASPPETPAAAAPSEPAPGAVPPPKRRAARVSPVPDRAVPAAPAPAGTAAGGAVEPTAAPPPAPAAHPADPPPPPEGALVRLDGATQAAAVRLLGDTGTFELPGQVPAGRYRVVAEFTPGVPEPTIWVEVPPGGTLSLRCALRSCRVVGG